MLLLVQLNFSKKYVSGCAQFTDGLFNCLIGGGAHKATSVISVEIASDLMPVMKIAPKMRYLLTVASSMYVGRVSPVILYFRGFMCGLTGERKGERLKTIKCRSTDSYEAQRLR